MRMKKEVAMNVIIDCTDKNLVSRTWKNNVISVTLCLSNFDCSIYGVPVSCEAHHENLHMWLLF